MYVKDTTTGDYYCYSDALMETGRFEKVESLPAAPAPTESPEVPAKPGPKPRQSKDK